MRLRIGTVEHDLTTRALVLGVLGPPASAAVPVDGAGFDHVLARADRLVADGADLLDVGGLPAGSPAGEEEETERLVPVVAALRARFDVPLCVATWRSEVLARCSDAGADVGHDRSGFADGDYLATAARAGVAVVATHSRLAPGVTDVVGEVRRVLAARVAQARAAGLADDRIVLDPGLDLGKSPPQSLTLLREAATLADLGPPLLLDTSNSRFLGVVLGLEADERRLASHAAGALGIARGCRIVRAADVRGARRVADVLAAVLAARLVHVGTGGEADDG